MAKEARLRGPVARVRSLPQVGSNQAPLQQVTVAALGHIFRPEANVSRLELAAIHSHWRARSGHRRRVPFRQELI
jgi:hypothetical protein